MRNSQEQVQIFNALHGKVSKDDLRTVAAGMHSLFYFENFKTTDLLRNLQLFLSCHFILINPESVDQKEDAILLLKLIHKICKELDDQEQFSLCLMD